MGETGRKLCVCGILRRHGIAFAAGLAFAIGLFITVNAASKPLSRPEYCGTACHEMDGAYKSWQASVHGANEKGLRAECIDCHLPPKDRYFSHMTAKALAGGKDLIKHFFGGEYDTEEIRKKVREHLPNERCQHCHVDLLAMPASDMVKEAHAQVLETSGRPEEIKCTECHEDAAHDR